MSKKPDNRGKAWTPNQESQLKQLANQNTLTRVIGLKLQRTEDAIRGNSERFKRITQAHKSITISQTKITIERHQNRDRS